MEKELKEITQELNAKMGEFEKVEGRLEELIESKASSEQIDTLQKSLTESGGKIDKLNEEIERMGESMKERTMKGRNPMDVMKDALTPEFLKKTAPIGKEGRVTLDLHPMNILKVGTVNEHTNLTFGTANTNSAVLPFNESGVGKAPDRQVYLVDLFNTATSTSPRVTWVERSARTDGAATRAEAAIMGQSDYTYIRRIRDVENISSYVVVTDEALEDWDQLQSEIRLELFGQLGRELDDQLLTGDGSTPNLAGVTSLCRTFDYTGLNGIVAAPNIFDAITAAATQVRAGYLYNPTHAVLHPTDFAKMNLIKDANNNYVLPPFMTANGMMVDGLQVVVNTGITAGQVLVGDFTKGTVFFRKGIDIRLWDQNSDNPIYGLKTITGNMRAALRIKTPDYNAFVYDAITDITTAIGV